MCKNYANITLLNSQILLVFINNVTLQWEDEENSCQQKGINDAMNLSASRKRKWFSNSRYEEGSIFYNGTGFPAVL